MTADQNDDPDEVLRALNLIQEDYAQGIEALESLALGGNAEAMRYIGFALSKNSENNARAFPWLLAASRVGHADAAWNIAMIYREWGNQDQMRDWIDRAAELGEEDAVAVRNSGYDVERFLETLKSSTSDRP